MKLNWNFPGIWGGGGEGGGGGGAKEETIHTGCVDIIFLELHNYSFDHLSQLLQNFLICNNHPAIVVVFLFLGGVGVVWFVFWMALSYDRPANHPRISIKEKEYIQSSIGTGQDTRKRVHVSLHEYEYTCMKHVFELWVKVLG